MYVLISAVLMNIVKVDFNLKYARKITTESTKINWNIEYSDSWISSLILS